MGQVVILGSSNAIPDDLQDNTYMLVKEGTRVILIDTGSSPLQRLNKIGINHDDLSDVILTHFHPDHVAGFPGLLMGLWLLGRRKPLDVYGFQYTISRMMTMIDLYDFKKWPDFFEVHFHEIHEEEGTLVLEDNLIRVTGSPVKHLIPTLGLRIEFLEAHKTLAYSCDTEPCDQLVRLAKGADVLIHEATGESIGHTSASQAGAVANKAGAKTLFLIHYSFSKQNPEKLLVEAHSTYQGAVHLTRDFMTLEF
jgi:ribonuclease Z